MILLVGAAFAAAAPAQTPGQMEYERQQREYWRQQEHQRLRGGLCEVFFSGDAVFEFRPDALVGIDKSTRRAETLDQVEYRGDARHVVVIPRSTLKLIVFDFEGFDRISWSGQNCRLTRVNAAARQPARRSIGCGATCGSSSRPRARGGPSPARRQRSKGGEKLGRPAGHECAGKRSSPIYFFTAARRALSRAPSPE